MLHVFGSIGVDPGRLVEVTAEATRFQALCTAEEGCIAYSLSWDVADPARLHLLEAWESTDAHTAHTLQSHVREWTGFIASRATGAPQFTKTLAEKSPAP